MATKTLRGSEKILAAFRAREITEGDIKEIAGLIDGLSGKVHDAVVTGGKAATGLSFSLTYAGDDVPRCGNDMAKILELLRKLKFPVRVPRHIIDGIIDPDFVHIGFEIGRPPVVAGPRPVGIDLGGLQR